MASLNLGKVGLLLRGDWDSDTDYAALDVVSHEGYSYAARVANKNVEPSAETAAYWQPLAESASVLATMLGYKNDAADSATAAAGSATAAATSASSATDALANEAADFSSSKAYAVGDYVIYNNGTHKYLYRFTAAHSAGAWVGTDAVQVALADDVSDLKSAIDSVDFNVDFETGMVNYDYDIPANSAPSGTSGASAIGIKRIKTSYELNTTSSPANEVKIKLNGTVIRTTDNSVVDSWDGIVLQEGHIYKVSNIYESGASSSDTPNAISVYNKGTHSTIGFVVSTGNIYSRIFTYTGSQIIIAWYIPRGATFSNYKSHIILQDITDSVMYNAEETSLRLNAFANLVDYYGDDAIFNFGTITAVRNKTRIMINGTRNSTIFVKINGSLEITNTSPVVDAWTGLQLTVGTRYRVVLSQVSGSVSGGTIGLSIYENGKHSTIGKSSVFDDKYIREFTAPNTGVNLIVHIPANTVLRNAEYVCILEELAVEESGVGTQLIYSGENLNIQRKMSCEKYMTISSETTKGRQGATAYGDNLFVTYNTMPMISVYNIRTRSHVYNIPFTAVDTYHCNNINFGNEKYDADDYFPLLYVSQENINEHKCLVFRITEENEVFSATLVQTITYPIPANVGMFYPNAFIDTINGFMILEGYIKETFAENEKIKLRIMGYDLPKLAEGDVTLDPANAFQNFTINALPTSCQGGFINGDKIVQAFGNPSRATEIYLGQISMSAERFVTLAELNGIGITEEPESVFLWEGHLYYFMQNRDVYKLYSE